MHPAISLMARVLMSAIFLNAGYGNISAYAGTQAYMQQHGLPGVLLPAVIALEVVGGLAVVLGIGARYAGFALAIFCLAAATIFHNDFNDQEQMTNFMKNLAMAGGFLLLFANGSGRYAVVPD